MRRHEKLGFLALAILVAVTAGCGPLTNSSSTGGGNAGAIPDTTAPTLISTSPGDLETGVVLNRYITAIFSEAIDPATVTSLTFTLKQGSTPVLGAVTVLGNIATFTPINNLAPNTIYTATITTGAKDLAGNALANNITWGFTTGSAVAAGPLPVILGMAGNFAILSKAGITCVPTSAITGDMGVSPIAATAITGFPLTLDGTGTFSTTPQVNGKVYAADYTSPTPSYLTTAINNMQAAYVDAAGRTLPDFTELGAGDISGMTLVPGTYKWSTGVMINGNVTLNGGPNDVWIFQVAGVLSIANGVRIQLSGGAQAKNIFWQVVSCTMGTTAHLEGIVLSSTAITLATGATVNGRLLAQTAVTLQMNTVNAPAILDNVPPTVASVIPVNLATSVSINGTVTVNFSEWMDPTTVNTNSIVLRQGATPIIGTVTYVGTVAIFKPNASLTPNTVYTVTVSTNVKDLAGNKMAAVKTWSFTTAAAGTGPSTVNLGTAGNFVILSKAGVTCVPTSVIIGDVGVSPIAAAAITGFALIMDVSGAWSTSGQVIGKVYAADYMAPTPSVLTIAVNDMQTAYTDAAGRSNANFTNIGGGEIGGMTLTPGLYTWGTAVTISSNITLSGGPNDIWIFQVNGDISMAASVNVQLTGGAQAKNVFWQAVSCTLAASSHLEGIVLASTTINLSTGASVNGRLLAQTAVTLQMNTIAQP